MPDEAAAAQGLAGFRENKNPPEVGNTPGVGATTPVNPKNGGTNAQIAVIPVPSITPNLIESLKKLGEEQGEDADVLANTKIQGKTKPNNYKVFREHAVLQDELFIVVGMMDSHFVHPIHLFIKFAAPGKKSDQYNGEYLAAIGDRVGAVDPPYVRVKKSYFKWREVKPVKE